MVETKRKTGSITVTQVSRDELIEDFVYYIIPIEGSWDKDSWQLPSRGIYILSRISDETDTFQVNGSDKYYRFQSHEFYK